MPIVNLTKTSEVGSGLPRIGKLHKGEKKTDANRPGKDLEYFRMEFEPEFADLREEWEALYGEKPDGFELVYMTHATVDEAFATWKEDWNSSATMLHRCDGEHQHVWYSQAAQAYSTAKEKCAVTGPNPCACKNVGRLNLLIPEFIQVTGILGYVMVETHSINDILTVYRTLADVQRINSGTLLGVPFSLGRATKKISAPKTGKNGVRDGRIKVNKSLFYLHVDPDFTRETLLPRLAQSGGFLSANQPQLAASTPQLDMDSAKKLLNSGAGQRRLGTAETPFELPPQPYADDEPDEPEPTPIVKPVEPPVTPVVTQQPQPPKAEQTVMGVDTVGSAMGKLKTRALAEIFNKDVLAMNRRVSQLMQEGKLPPAMSIDDALEVIRPTPSLTHLEGIKVYLNFATKKNGAYEANATIEDTGEKIVVKVTTAQAAVIRAKGHEFPLEEPFPVYVLVTLTIVNGEICIKTDAIEQKDNTPIDEVKNLASAQQMFSDIGMSQAAKNQLEHA
jgi:hypothetical protein